MAIQKTQAVLIRKKDLRETSLILTFFTRDFGKVHGILKGARGSRARSNVNPLFFSINQVVYYEKKRSDIFIISQCEAEEIFLNILKEWDRASVAYYMLELVDVLTETGGPSPEIFDALVNALRSLDTKKEVAAIRRLFEVKLLIALGSWPGAENFKLTKGAMSSLSCFEREPWQSSSKIKLTREVEEEIKNVTDKLIAENLDRPLKTEKLWR